MNDSLIRFAFPGLGARGALVQLDQSWQQLIERRDYPAQAETWLGQAAAASVLLGTRLKQAATLSLQLQGPGVLRLLFAEARHRPSEPVGLRGLVRHGGGELPSELGAVLREATLVVTLSPEGGQRYQGIVPGEGDSLARCLEAYFEQSEQLPTRLRLAAGGGRARGLLLQRIPGEGGLGLEPAVDDDGWDRLGQLLGTLGDAELLSCEPALLLHRLFHEEALADEAVQPVRFECSCSPERVAEMLRSLGRSEAFAALDDSGGAVRVDCEFCNRHYRFDAIDLESLFNPAQLGPGSGRLQ